VSTLHFTCPNTESCWYISPSFGFFGAKWR